MCMYICYVYIHICTCTDTRHGSCALSRLAEAAASDSEVGRLVKALNERKDAKKSRVESLHQGLLFLALQRAPLKGGDIDMDIDAEVDIDII